MAFHGVSDYYITACAHNRRRILDRPDVHDTFIQFGLRATEHGVWVGRYVIMPLISICLHASDQVP